MECSFTIALLNGYESADLRHDLGVLYVATGRDEYAVTQFIKAFEINPSNPHYLYDIALLYGSNSMYDKAEPYFLRLREAMPGDMYVKSLADANSEQVKSKGGHR